MQLFNVAHWQSCKVLCSALGVFKFWWYFTFDLEAGKLLYYLDQTGQYPLC